MRHLCASIIGLGILGGVLTCAGIAIRIQVKDLPNARDQLAHLNDSRVVPIRYQYIQPELLTEAALASSLLKCKGKLNITDISTGAPIYNQTYKITCSNLKFLFDKQFFGYFNWDNSVITSIHPRKLYTWNVNQKQSLRDGLGIAALVVVGVAMVMLICGCLKHCKSMENTSKSGV